MGFTLVTFKNLQPYRNLKYKCLLTYVSNKHMILNVKKILFTSEFFIKRLMVR